MTVMPEDVRIFKAKSTSTQTLAWMLRVPMKCLLLLSPPSSPPPKREKAACLLSHLWLCYCRGSYVLHLQCISLTRADFLLDSLHVRGIISWYSLSYLALLTQTKSFYRAQWQRVCLEVAQFECPPTFLLSPSMLITAATISTNISRNFRSRSHDYHRILRFAE